MTDIREICAGCNQEFSPLASARGIAADYCSRCFVAKVHLASLPGQQIGFVNKTAPVKS